MRYKKIQIKYEVLSKEFLIVARVRAGGTRARFFGGAFRFTKCGLQRQRKKRKRKKEGGAELFKHFSFKKV